MILEKNNLQTAQEWTKSYIELIASYVHSKTGNHLRSHLRAIMALDHRRLIRPGKKIRPNFLRSTSLLYKILPTSLGRVNHPFILFIHHIWGETVLSGAVFIIQTSDRLQYFTIFAIQISLIKYSGRWKHAWAFSEIVKKIFKITYTASRLSLLTIAKWMNNYRVKL